MRELGLNPSNGGTTRTIRARAALLGLDTSHFRANRSWSDAVLREAITGSRTWDEVLTKLGLSARAGGERALVRAHAFRLGVDASHLGGRPPHVADAPGFSPDLIHLRHAAESLAVAWFRLCGCNVALPATSDCYDLIVETPNGLKRVQVKTTAHHSKDGWAVQVSRRPYSARNNARLVPYDPEVIDLFFIVDGDLNMYLIPSRAVGGYTQILLRSYRQYIVGNAAGFMRSQPPAA
jgi:hypothetical protein